MVDDPPKPPSPPRPVRPPQSAPSVPAALRPPPVVRAVRHVEPERFDADGLPIVNAAPKLLWCLHCQRKFDPKADKSHRRHPVRDHHPKGDRSGAVSSDDPNISAQSDARYSVGITGWDRCLGGGFVRGSAIIVGGKTGCGKSTIVREVCYLACLKLHADVLYVSGEETSDQVRLGMRTGGITHPNLKVAHTSSFEDVERLVAELKPHIVVLDSINRITTMHASGSKAGSVQAIEALAARIVHLCKKTRLKPIVIAIGHETKDGEIAGPQSALHDLDVVIHFRIIGSLRELETEKNRFGEAPVKATFEFKGKRLVEVKDAATRILPTVTGGVGCTLHAGINTTLAVEAFASLPRAEDAPPATVRAAGIADDKFKDIVDAVATHTSIVTAGRSIKAKIRVPNDAANVADKAVDAAFVVALASTVEQLSLPADLAVFGELSPSGRLEFDPNAEARINAAKTARARTVIGPLGAPSVEGINYIAVPDIRGLVSWVRANCEFVGVKPEAQPAAAVKTESSECPFDLPSHELSDVRPGVVGET